METPTPPEPISEVDGPQTDSPQVPADHLGWGESAPLRIWQKPWMWVAIAVALIIILVGPLVYLRTATPTRDSSYAALDTYAHSIADGTPVNAAAAAKVASAVAVRSPDGVLTLWLRGDAGCWKLEIRPGTYTSPTHDSDDACR